jgi:signal transduction histidine kinase/ActR/RegA family two-component response regulator
MAGAKRRLGLTELIMQETDNEKKRKANERARLMLDATPLGAIYWDKNIKCVDCNEESVRLFGVKDKQEYLDRFMELSPEYQPDGSLSKEKSLEFVKKAFTDGYFRFEWIHQKLDGELIPCEVTLIRVEYEDDYSVLGYTRDLRELKQMMKKIEQRDSQLEAALKAAQDANTAKSKFLANMSHEIRTPMNVILGVTESYLQNENVPRKYLDGFEKIYNAGDLLLHLVNDILDLSKIDAGKLELIPVRYETSSLINDTAQMNTIRFQHKPIRFNLLVAEDIPLELIGDELRIKQILNNLLSNAFKYTNEGEVTLSFAVEKPAVESPHKTDLIIRVSDTGQGMTKEQIKVLFDEYTRFNSESNRKISGTGLGMAITHNLVNLMNGKLTVESAPGKGTVITARIPQKIAGSGTLGGKTAEKLEALNFTAISQKKSKKLIREPMPYGKVLIVDDMKSNLDVAVLLLTPYQLQIDIVESGAEAVALIKKGKEYDIIFMDHMMPDMDGMETTRRIRALGYKYPIFALTANAVVGQQDNFLKNGFDGYISKPIDVRQLNDTLNKYVRDKYVLQNNK